MRSRAIIGVIGSGDEDPGLDKLAEEVGSRIAGAGYTLVNGGLSGVMLSSARGAKGAGGTTVGLLPGPDPEAANPYIDIPIATGLGEGRNLLIVRAAAALIAIGGGYGTLSEIALALKTGRPVVGLNTWDLAIDMPRAEGAEEAVAMALRSLAGPAGP